VTAHGLWNLLGIYVFTGAAALFLAVLLAKREKAPAVSYLAFTVFGGLFVLFILIDTGRDKDIPPVRWGSSVFRIEKRLRKIERGLIGYETDTISMPSIAVTREPNPTDPDLPYRVAFPLQHAAVPDSVFVFENDVPISPTRFHVDGNRITISSAVDVVATHQADYVVRYLKRPLGAGESAGEW
jgi:hypothetical protein